MNTRWTKRAMAMLLSMCMLLSPLSSYIPDWFTALADEEYAGESASEAVSEAETSSDSGSSSSSDDSGSSHSEDSAASHADEGSSSHSDSGSASHSEDSAASHADEAPAVYWDGETESHSDKGGESHGSESADAPAEEAPAVYWGGETESHSDEGGESHGSESADAPAEEAPAVYWGGETESHSDEGGESHGSESADAPADEAPVVYWGGDGASQSEGDVAPVTGESEAASDEAEPAAVAEAPAEVASEKTDEAPEAGDEAEDLPAQEEDGVVAAPETQGEATETPAEQTEAGLEEAPAEQTEANQEETSAEQTGAEQEETPAEQTGAGQEEIPAEQTEPAAEAEKETAEAEGAGEEIENTENAENIEETETEKAPDYEGMDTETLNELAAERVGDSVVEPLLKNADTAVVLESTVTEDGETVVSEPVLAATAEDLSQKSALQGEIDNALVKVTGKLSGRVKVILGRDSTYEGDAVINLNGREKSDDFELEISAEDAGEDGMQGDGKTVVKGNITIQGVKVIMNSVILDPDKTVNIKSGGELVLTGSKNFANEMTIKVGDKSRATINTTDDDDVINLETEQGAEKVTINTGEGLDKVNATLYGGEVEIDTGDGDDTLSLNVGDGIGMLEAKAGSGNNTIDIVNNGAAKRWMTVTAGDGDDTINIDVRDKAGDLTVNTGKGSDVVDVKKGDHFSLENVEYEEYITENESPNVSTNAKLFINNGDLSTRVTVDAAVALALKGVELNGIGAQVHLKGKLAGPDEIKGLKNPITVVKDGIGREVGFRLHTTLDSEVEKQDYTLDFNYGGNTYTDSLENKETIELYATGDKLVYDRELENFVNYVVKSPTQNLKSITFGGEFEMPKTLTNLVLDAGETKDAGDRIVVNDLKADSVNVLLRGKTIDINGKVKVLNLRAESYQGSTSMMQNLDNMSETDFGEFLANMVSVKDSATINVNKGADVHAENNIALVTSVKHVGGMFTFLPAAVNLVNVKVADAKINIADGAELSAEGGNLTAEARIKTTLGYEWDEKTRSEQPIKIGMPLAVTVVVNNAAVNVAKGAYLYSKEDTVLHSQSDVTTATYANSDKEIPSPADVAVTVITNNVKSRVDGKITSGKKTQVSATGSFKEETQASTSVAQGGLSGGYVAVSVVDQNVDALVGSTAEINAGGNLRVATYEFANATTKAISGEPKSDEDDSPSIKKALKTLVVNVVKVISGKLKDAWTGADKLEAKVDKLFGDVAKGDYSVRMVKTSDDNDAKGSATVTTQTQTENGSTAVKATVNVQPVGGCKVSEVGYRYLKPGEDHYTYVTLIKSPNGRDSVSETFNVPNADVEVYVRYTGEPNGQNAAAGDNQNNQDDKDVNVNELVNDAAEGAGNAGSEQGLDREEPGEGAKSYTLSIAAAKNGAVVTWRADDKKSLTKVYEGEKVRLIPNPNEKFALKADSLTVTYKVKEDGKEITKTDIVAPDDNGDYYFTVPKGVEGDKLTVKSAFEYSETTEEKQVRNTQATGAIAVSVVNNDSHALIEKGAKVTVGGTVDMFGFKTNRNTTTADGTAVEAKAEKKNKKDKPKPFIATSYGVSGAEFALAMNANMDGYVTGTIDPEENENASSYSPVFTIENDKAERLQKIVVSYYTKLEGPQGAVLGQGTRRTITLTRQADGTFKEEGGTQVWFDNTFTFGKSGDYQTFQPHLTGLAVQNGTTVDINFVFNEEGVHHTVYSGQKYLISNPIQISYNKLKDKKDNSIISMGTVTFDHKKDGKYYFRVEPNTADGYTIKDWGPEVNERKSNKAVLYASWIGADGKLQKTELLKDEKDALTTANNVWYFMPTKGNIGVPDGAVVTINAVFSEDLRDIKKSDDFNAKEAHGDVTIKEGKLKAGDEEKLILKADAGYVASGVKVEYFQPGRLTWKTLDADKINLDPIKGEATFIVPQTSDAESSHIRITPVFTKKDIELGKKDKSKDFVFSVSDNYSYVNGTVTVSPSKDKTKAGYKVTSVTVRNSDGMTKTFKGDTFTIGEDWVVETNKYLEVSVEMAQKTVRVADATLENGKVTAVSGYADAGEKVIVKPEAEEGYRVKTGTLKAQILTGTESRQVVIRKDKEGNYFFNMPSGADKNTVVNLQCEFEPGSDKVEKSIGTGLAVGVLTSENEVGIKGGTVSAANGYSLVGLSVGGKATTEALAGYSAGNLGVAGALGVQVARVDNTVAIRKDDNGSITLSKGGIFMLSKGKTDTKLTANAAGKKTPEAKETGVGAGIAVAVTNMNTLGIIEDGVRLAGYVNPKDEKAEAVLPTFKTINVNVGQKYKDEETAKAGAAGGSAWVPVAAVDVSNISGRAYMGRLNFAQLLKDIPAKNRNTDAYKLYQSGVLPVSGKVKVKSAVASAKAEFNHNVVADASSRGGTAAVGGAFAITWVSDTAESKLNQSLSGAKEVQVSSNAGSAVQSVATAAVSGGVKSNKGDADKQGNKLLGGAGNIAGKYGGMDANKIKNDANSRQKAETAESSVAAAGAFVLNVQKGISRAEVLGDTSVVTKGKLTVNSQNRTAAVTKADASATKSDTGVGVGVAINIVDIDNIAKVGSGYIEAGELNVSANIATVPGRIYPLTVYTNTATVKEALKSQIEQAIMEYAKTKLGSPWDTIIEKGAVAKIIGTLAGTTADNLLKDLGLEKLVALQIGEGAKEAMTKVAGTMRNRVMTYLKTLAAPFYSVYVEALESFDYMDSTEDWETLIRDAIGTTTTELAGDAWQTVLEKLVKDGGNAMLGSAIGMVSDKLSGKGWSADSVKDSMKKVVSGAMDSFLDKFVDTIFNKMGDRISWMTSSNMEKGKVFVARAKKLLKERAALAVLDDLWQDIDKTFREEVYDYEELLVKYGEGKFVDNIQKDIYNALKDSAVGVSKEVLEALVGAAKVKIPKESVNDRHIINTDAISGAGGADTSGAGSLAIAVVHLNTVAEIADGSKGVKVSGTMGVTADELRRVRTRATAAVDARGEADSKDDEGSSEGSSIDESGVVHVNAPDSKVTVDVGVGGTASFERLTAATDPKIWLEPGYGYKLTDGAKLSGTYKLPESDDENEFTVIVHEENGKFYIKPLEDIDSSRDPNATIKIPSNEMIVDVPIVFEEVLYKLTGTPDAHFDYNENKGVMNGEVLSVDVKDREMRDHRIETRPGEVVEITVNHDQKWTEGDRVKDIVVTYTDAKGQEKKLTLAKNEIIRTTVNAKETVYVFTMPEGEVTNIDVTFEHGEEDTSDTDASGRKIGVGASFALTYGKSTTEAKIGKRDDGVSAGSLSVSADVTHEQENYSTAGTDPLKGTNTAEEPEEDSDKVNEKDLGVDASVSVFILDNDVIASIAKGTKVTTTAATQDEEGKEVPLEASWKVNGSAGKAGSKRTALTTGGLVVQALEQGGTDTRANAFATGSTTAIGATVAVNVALSAVKVNVGDAVTTTGKLTYAADSVSKDRTWAFATALGSDVQRVLNKFADKAEKYSKNMSSITTGKYFDDKIKNKDKKKKANDTSKKITDRLNDERVKDKDGDQADDSLSVSTNVLRSQNAKLDAGEDANDAAKDAAKKANDSSGREDIQANDQEKKDSKLQVAAAVGVTVALHNAAVTADGSVTAGEDVAITATNSGNFNTRSTAAAMSVKAAEGRNTIAAAVGVSVNSNKATVDVKGDVKSTRLQDVKVASSLTMNLEEGYSTRLPVQALAGSVSGKGTSNSIGGAVAVVVSHGVSKADVSAAKKITGGKVAITAYDKSKLGARAGGINISTGANVGIGASVAVLYSDNEVKASVGDGADIEASVFELSATKKAITWEDFKLPWTWKDLFTDSSEPFDDQRETMDTGLIDISHDSYDPNSPYEIKVNLDTYKLMKLFDAGNMLAFNNYYTAAIAGSLVTGASSDTSANAFNGAGSFSIVRTDNRVDAVMGKNVNVHMPKVGGGPDGVKLAAEDTSTARLIGGAIAGGSAMRAAGLTVTFLKDGDHAKVTVGDNANINAQKLTIDTKGDTSVQAFNAAATVNTSSDASLSLGGAINVLLLKNEAEANIGNNVKLTSNKGVSINAKSDMDLLMVSAGITGAAKGVAAGGTVAYIDDSAASRVIAGQNHNITANEGDVNISAKTTDRMFSVLASASGAFSKSAAVAGAINVLNSEAKGNVTLGSGNSSNGVIAKQGDIAITGTTDTRAINITVGAAGSKGAAVGMSVNVNRFNRESIVDIMGGNGYNIAANGGDIMISADGNDTTIMAGLAVAGSTGKFSLSGNLPILHSTNTIKTNVHNGAVTATGETAIASHLSDHTYSIAGSIALANRGSAVGGTLMILKRENNVTTDAGTAVIESKTAQKRLYDKLPGKPDFQGVYVGATVNDTTVAGAAGAALAESVGITGNLLLAFNNNTVKADASKAYITALNHEKSDGGSVTVEAKDNSNQVIISGGLNFGKFMGLGAAVVSLSANKKVDALLGETDAHGNVNVIANNRDTFFELAVNGAFSQVMAVGIGAAVQSLNSKVNARLKGDVTSRNGGLDLTAKNTSKMINSAVVVAGAGDLAAAPVGAVTVYRGVTNAILESGSIKAKEAVKITADADKDIQTYTLGAAGARGVGLSGAVTFNTLKDTTRAQALKDVTIEANSLDVNAKGNFKNVAASGAISVAGTAGVAVNGMISIIKGGTLAEFNGTAKLKEAANVNATSNRDVVNVVASIGGGGTVGAGVTVMGLVAGDKLDQDAADLLTYGSADKHTDDNKAFDADKFIEKIGDAGADVSGLKGGKKDDGTTETSLSEDLKGNGSNDSKMNVGNGGKFDGASKLQDDKLRDGKGPSDNTPSGETDDIKNAKKLGDGKSDEIATDAVVARIGADATVTAGGIDVKAEQETLADLYGAAIGIGGTLGGGISGAALRMHSNVFATSLGKLSAAGKAINVQAISKSGNRYVGESKDEKDRVEALKKTDLGDTLNPSQRSIRAVSIAAGGGSAAGIAASIAAVRTNNITKATMGGTVDQAASVNVDAHSDYENILAATIGLSGAGGFAASASVAVSVAEGTVESKLDKGAVIKGDKTNVSVTTNSVAKANAVAASIAASGGFGFAAGVAVASNNLTQNTSVDRGVKLDTNGGTLKVSGASDTRSNTYLLGVSGSMVALGLSAAVSKVKPTMNTTVGVNGSGTAELGKLSKVEILNDAVSEAAAKVLSISAGAAALQGNLLLVFNDTDSTARMANASGTLDDVTINADLQANGDAKLASATVGGLAAGISVSYVDVNSKNRAILDTDNLTATFGKLAVTTGEGKEGHKTTTAETAAISAGLGGIVAGSNISAALNRAQSLAEISGSRGLTATKGVTLKSNAVGNAVADGRGVEVALINLKIAGMVTLADNEATAKAKMDLKGGLEGDLNASANVTGETTASQMTGSGALLEVKANAAAAYGKTNALVEIDLDEPTVTDEAYALNASSSGSNKVTTKMDNLSVGGITIVGIGGIARSDDVYESKVNLRNGKFNFSQLNVKGEYNADVKSDITPSAGGMELNWAKVGFNSSNALSKTHAGAELALDDALVNIKNGDVNVNAQGKATADAKVKPAEFSLSMVNIGISKADADMSATQAATLRLKNSTLTGANHVNVKSTVNNATADAIIGTSGVRNEKKSSVKAALVSAEVNTAVAHERIQSVASILGEDGNNNIRSAYLDVNAGMADGVTSRATGSSNGAASVGFATGGNLDATAETTDFTDAVVTNVNATVTNDINVKAATKTKADSVGFAPGNLSVLNVAISTVKADVGTENKKQTANVLIGDDTKLKSENGNVNISARNEGDAEAHMQSKNQYSVGTLNESNQPTHGWYDTGVKIGERVEIDGRKLAVNTETKPQAVSILEADGLGLVLNAGTMKGENYIHETNSLLVGKYSKLTAEDGISLQTNSSVRSHARSVYRGGFGIIGTKAIKADTEVDRDVSIIMGSDVTIDVRKGGLDIQSNAGRGDSIETYSYQRATGALTFGKAYATTKNTLKNSVIIDHTSKISAQGDVNIAAITGGSGRGYFNVRTTSDVDASCKGFSDILKIISNPDSYATSNIDLTTAVAIDRGQTGQPKDKYTNITSKEGKITVRAGNDGFDSETTGIILGDHRLGKSDSYSTNNTNIHNLVWVDATNFSGKKGTQLLSNAGIKGDRGAMSMRAYANSSASFSANKTTGHVTETGTKRMEIRTNSRSSVDGGNRFTHIASNNWDINLEGRDRNPDGKAIVKCDFCDGTDSSGMDDTTRDSYDRIFNDVFRRRYSDYKNGDQIGNVIQQHEAQAFTKALAVLDEIKATVETVNANGITKARYGEEEENKAIEGIYVLDVRAMLTKDARLTGAPLSSYRVWSNTATQDDVYLLPNAARLTQRVGGWLQYATDVLNGDPLNDGRPHKIDIITALNAEAFAEPVIPVGSAGSLDFSTGTLTIPELSDVELYLYEISGKWVIDSFSSGFFRFYQADQSAVDACVLDGSDLPHGGNIVDSITEDGVVDGWKRYWIGLTPANAESDDQMLYFLMVNEATDEVDAFSTSVSALARGEQPVHVSFYIFRDSSSDRRGEERYNVMFFNTPAGRLDLVKAVSDVLENRTLEIPRSLKIVLRRFELQGADLPGYSISDHLFAMNDGTDGSVSMFDGFYQATLEGDTFDSAYTRIEGIHSDDPIITIKANQPIWPVRTGEKTGEDLEGRTYRQEDDGWHSDEAPAVATDDTLAS